MDKCVFKKIFYLISNFKIKSSMYQVEWGQFSHTNNPVLNLLTLYRTPESLRHVGSMV